MKFKLYFILLFTSFIMIGQSKNQTIGFKENKGQIIDQNGKSNDVVKYLLNSRGLNVQLKKHGFSYDVYEIKKHIRKHRHQEQNSLVSLHNNKNLPDYTLEYSFHRIDIDFINANTNVELITEEKSNDYDNYYNVPNKPEGITHVHQYKQITYKNIYPNIDVVFSIPKDTLKTVEYNFVVHPKGNIQDIQLKFSGVPTELNHETLLLKTRFGKMEETLPESWTETQMSKKSINVAYTKIKNNVYGFKTTNDISDKTVIIDPLPIRLWGTYYGGEGTEYSFDITTDKNNYLYIAGATGSSTNIATSGTSTSQLNGNLNLFFAKLDPDGKRIWGTYFYHDNGLNNHDVFIKTDSQSNLLFTTKELFNSNVATVGAFQEIKNKYFDVILGKLNPEGLKNWVTYYGGSDNEEPNAITIDTLDNVYIAGETFSSDKLSSTGSFQVTKGGIGLDAFIAKFSPTGNRIWGTYYGGEGADSFFSLNVSEDNFLYAVGTQNSKINIASVGASQEFSDGNMGGMIVKFDLQGQRIWGTYICNDSFVYYSKLQGNNLNIIGTTFNKASIATPNTLFENYLLTNTYNLGKNPPEDGFIVSFNIETQRKNWGTYFPSEILGIDINKNGETYISGSTDLKDLIATQNSYLSVNNNSSLKSYIVKLNILGQRVWGTYYGGNSSEQWGQIHIDNNQFLYLYGLTGSTTGIASPGAQQTSLSPNNYDTFLAKFKDCSSIATLSNNSPICGGNTLELKASGGTNYNWTGPNGFSSTLQNPVIPNTSITNSGQYSCAITGTGDCDSTLTTDVIIGDTNSPVPNTTILPTINGDCSTIIPIPSATDSCDGLILATTTNPITNLTQGTHTIVWKYTDSNNKSTTQNQIVNILNQSITSVSSPQNFCIQENTTLNSVSIFGQNIKWYDTLTSGNLLSNNELLQNGKTYYASQTINGCESDRVPVRINIQNTSVPSLDSNHIFCASQNPTISSIPITGTAIKWYDANGNSLINTSPLLNNQQYYATQTINNCESSSKSIATISLISRLPAANFNKSFCDTLNDNIEVINLTDYNSSIIVNSNEYNFNYYSTLLGAENELFTTKINNPTNYTLITGETIIYVRINSDTPCFAIAELKLSLFPKPNILINDLMPICENSSITINAGSNFTNYLWSNGATTPSVIISNPGDYSVLVTKDYSSISCSTSKNFSVLKSTIATITSIETKDWSDTENTIIVYTTGTGDYEYSLDGINYQNNNVFTNVVNGKYTVSIRDKNGCGIVTNDVYLLMYPKFFTPNGDGFNDNWKIKFSDNENDIVIKIFDRYGKLIKELKQNDSWNGTYIGIQLPADDYWFTVIRPQTFSEYKGHFSLKR
jgi:gliding motility-associated-like protein